MPDTFGKLLSCQRGATAIEYGLIAALIVLGILGAVQGVATEIIQMWSTVETETVTAMQRN